MSSFSVGKDGSLTLLDVKPTGNVVNGRSGTARSLAYASSTRTLYVLHSFGPDHLRLMSVDKEGKLTPLAERYTANTTAKPNRIPTMVVLSPGEKFVLVRTTFDQPAQANLDGSPILWAPGPDGTPHSIASNAPDPDGLVVFRVNGDGALGMPTLQDGGGGSPFFPLFLRARPDAFVLGFAVADGISINTLDEDGRVSTGPVVPINTDAGKPTGSLNEITSDGSRTEPSGRGYFPGALNGADVTVKASKRFADTGGWGYFNFNHHEPKAPTAKVKSKGECAFCHIQSAEKDEVWTQFYPRLDH